MRIAFFDAKSYDIESFNEVNKDIISIFAIIKSVLV